MKKNLRFCTRVSVIDLNSLQVPGAEHVILRLNTKEDDEESEIISAAGSTGSATSLKPSIPPSSRPARRVPSNKPIIPKLSKRTRLHPIFLPSSPLRIDFSSSHLMLSPTFVHEKLTKHATQPSHSVIYLVHPRLGQIEIRSSRQRKEKKVNVWDVIYGLHQALHQPLYYQKYLKLGTTRKLTVGWAYCRRVLSGFKDGVEGLKLVDLLGPGRVFVGLEPLPSSCNTFLLCFGG